MSDTVIQVENLSKKYIIAHEVKENYKRLSEVMVEKAKNFGRRIIKPSRLHNDPAHEEFWALKDINFAIKQGERIGIIGRNGAGKSTLLKILSRITAPTTGKIVIKGRMASLLEVGTGFHPELTGRENIFLNGSILGMSKVEITKKFDEIVDFSGVEKFLDTPVKRYSSGMHVRLAFSVAAHMDPEILIVDEVLAVGDYQFQKKCLGKIQEVNQEGRTILFVSHNLGVINRLCNQCMLLHNGKIVSMGETSTVVNKYLSYNINNNRVYQQESDLEKDMNLRTVLLNPDENALNSDVEYISPINIRINYDVNKPVTNVSVWISIENMEGIRVFTSVDYDQYPDMLEIRKPGHYQADVKIPEKWLNVGQYKVIVGIVKNHPLVVYDRVEAITFNVLEIGTPNSLIRSAPRVGVFQPILDWKLTRLNN